VSRVGGLSVAAPTPRIVSIQTAPFSAESRTRSLSPSRAADFKTCPLLYRLRTIDRLPQRPSAAAARGTLVHAVLERLYDLPAAGRTVEQAKSMVEFDDSEVSLHYLLSHLRTNRDLYPELVEFVVRKREDPKSRLYKSPLLEGW